MRALSACTTAVLAATLCGCIAVPADKPSIEAYDAARAGLPAAGAAPIVEYAWWKRWHDPQLDALVERALRGNPTLALARARVAAARAQAELAAADAGVNLALDLNPDIQRYSEHSIIPPPLAGAVKAQARVAFDLSWDLDFWGRHAALIEAAGKTAQARAADVAAARLALTDAVVRAYIRFDHAGRLRELAQRELDQRRTILNLTQRRFDSGLDTRAELAQAQGALPQAQVDYSLAEEAIVLAQHQLAALAAATPAEGEALRAPQPSGHEWLEAPTTLPADLLARRPDIAGARFRVEAASRARDALRADFYPNVNLSVFAGLSAIGLENVFDLGSRSYGVAPALHLPLFDAGRRRARFRVGTAEVDQAIAAYNESVLDAVREVADVLASTRANRIQREAQARALAAAEDAYRIAQKRFDAGLANYLTVLSTQTQLLAQRRLDIELATRRDELSLNLIRALGGGFSAADAALTQESTPR